MMPGHPDVTGSDELTCQDFFGKPNSPKRAIVKGTGSTGRKSNRKETFKNVGQKDALKVTF